MNVAIVGASSRIAQALVRHYASQGASVAAVARDLEEAERVAADARVRFGVRAVAYAVDATETATHAALIAQIEADLGPLDVGVVAVGEMGDQAESVSDPEAARRVMDVNYVGAASLSEAFVSAMAARGHGAVVGLSSVAGERGRQSNYVYGSAKGAYTLYLDGLRARAFKLGVRVVTVKLGFIDTRMTFGLKTKIPIASPDAAALAIASAAERGTESLYYPPFWAPVMAVIRTIPAGVFKRLSL